MKLYCVEGFIDGEWVNMFPPNNSFRAETAIAHLDRLIDDKLKESNIRYRIKLVKEG